MHPASAAKISLMALAGQGRVPVRPASSAVMTDLHWRSLGRTKCLCTQQAQRKDLHWRTLGSYLTFTRLGYKAADRDATIERLVGDVVYKAGGREVKVRDEVFVVESVTDTYVRVRAVEVAEQTCGRADT